MPTMTTPGVLGRRPTSARRTSVKKATRNQPARVTPIKVTAATAVGSVLTITFDQPIVLGGTPQYGVDVAGADPASAALTSPTTVAITYDAAIAAATEITIPFEEPTIRNSSGGFVSTSTFPV